MGIINYFQSNLTVIVKILICLFIILFLVPALSLIAQTSWTGSTSTVWHNSANWTNGVPNSTTDAIIGDANFTGTYQPQITANAFCKSLTIGTGTKASTLTMSSNNKNLSVAGDISIGPNGVINQTAKSTITLTGNWNNSGTFTSTNKNSMVVFAGASQSLNGTATFSKLKINAGSTVLLNANILVTTLIVQGTLDPNEQPTYLVQKGAPNGSLKVGTGGTILIKAATFAGNYDYLPNRIGLGAGSIVDYAATSQNQTISNSFRYSTLRISGAMTKSLSGNLPILDSSASTTGNIIVAAGTLDLLGYTADRGSGNPGGSFIVANGATLKIGGTNTFPANYQTHLLGISSTVEYSGTNQIVSWESYGNLKLSSSSGAVVKTMPVNPLSIAGDLISTIGTGTSVSFTAGESIDVYGNVTIGNSTTFNGSNYTHSVAGNWTNNGTYTGSGQITFTGLNTVISGTGTNNFGSVVISGQGITASTTTNLTVSGDFSTSGAGTFTHSAGGSGTLTMSGSSKTISGTGIILNNLNITGSVSTGSSLVIAGDLNVTGSSFTASAGTITMTGTSKTISGTGTKSFNALYINGSISTAVNFSLTSNLSVLGSLTATAGTVSFIGNSTLSGTANLFNVVLNGTMLQLGSNSVLGIAGTLTLNSGTFNATSTAPNTVHYNGSNPQTVISTTYHNIKFSGSGLKTAGGALTINGDLTINSGATLNASSYTHSLYGNWINDGTFTPWSSTIQLLGTSDINIGGSNSTMFNNLIVNKNSSTNLVTLDNDVITSSLNMSQGEMHTGTNSVTVTSSRTGNGIIIGTITRTHTFTNGTAYTFEGPNNSITFTGSGSNPSSITVTTVLDGPADFVPAGTSINRTYTISQSGGSGYSATLRLHYEDVELNGNDEPILNMFRYAGGVWADSGKTSNSETDNWVERINITDISGRWTLQSKLSGILDWVGTVDNNWENASNWAVVSGSPAIPPDETTYVRLGFSSFTNQPTINSSVRIRSLSFGSTQAVALTLGASAQLTVVGSTGNLSGLYTSDVTHTILVNNNLLDIGGNLVLSDGTNNRRINISIGNGDLVVNGRFDHPANSDLTVTGYAVIKIAGNWNRTGSATFNPGNSTVIYNGSGGQIVAGGITYYDLIIKKPSGTATLLSSATVNGNLTTDSTGGTFRIMSNLTVTGNVTIGTGTAIEGTSSTISVGGNWIRNGTFSPGSSTLIFNGAGSQSIASSTFNNLTINKASGIVLPTGNLTINGDLTLMAGILDLGTYTANRSSTGGTLTLGANTTLKIGTGSEYPANYVANNLASSSTVEYYGTLPQTVVGITYGNLTLSNGSSNVKTLGSTANIMGDLLINSGASFDASAFSLNVYGNWNNAGTFIPSSSTVSLNGTSKSLNGATTFSNLSITGTYTGYNDITVTGNTNINGSFDASSNNTTFEGNFVKSGTFTSGGIVTFTGTKSQTISMDGGFTNTGTVNFNGTVAPLFTGITSPTLFNVNLNNTGGITPVVGWNVGGIFTVANGVTFTAGNYTFTFGSTFTNNGTVTSSGVLYFNPASSVTLKLIGTSFSSTGLVEFGGSGLTTIVGGPLSFNSVNVTNTNPLGIVIQSNWSVGGNLTVGTGSALNAGTGLSHTISGDLTNNGIFSGGTSTITFNGDSYMAGTGTTTLHNISITGIDTSLIPFGVTGNFVNNGIFDAEGYMITFSGGYNTTISGTTSPTILDMITIQKISSSVTLGVNLDGLSELSVVSGIFDASTYTITQNTLGGILSISSGASMKVGGSNTLPTFNTYSFNPSSTVEYNGISSQLILSTPAYGNLVLSTGGTKTANGALTINGSLMNMGVTLDDNGYIITVKGNSTNTGTHTGTGKITLSGGSTIHLMSGSGSYNNFELNDVNDASLSANPTFSGVLTLTNGKIYTGTNKIIINSTGSISRTNGYIAGNLQKYISTGATTKLFEIGDSTKYTPVNISFTNVTTPGDLVVNTTKGDHPDIFNSGIDANKSVNRIWNMANSGISFDDYSATFNFDPTDIDAGANTNNFLIAKKNGSWTHQTVGTRTSTSTQAIGMTSFSDFQIGEGLPLDHFLVEYAGGGNIPTQTAGTSFNIKITAQDASNHTVISFTGTVDITSTGNLISGGGTTGSFTNGVLASHAVTISNTGNFTITATKTGGSEYGTSNSFAVYPGTATQVRVETASDGSGIVVPSQNLTSGNSITVYSIRRDAYNNFIDNVAADSWSLENITGGVVSGDLVPGMDSKSAVITGHLIGSADIKATSGSLTTVKSGTITVVVGSPNKLAFGVQPSNTTAGSAITPAVTVRIEDANGNLVTTDTRNVTLAIGNNPGGGTLSGTTTVAAAGGVATFSDLSINKTGTGYTLDATSDPVLTGVSSNSFNITPGAPNKVVFIVQPSNTTAGVTISPSVTVQVRDIYNNDVPTAGISVSMSLYSGTGTLNGTTVQLTNSSGLATFNDLSINIVGSKNLSASSPGLNSDISIAFDISAASASQLAFIQQPTDATAGTVISPAITVQLKDPYGNNVESSGISVSMTLSSGTGTLSGTLTQNTDSYGIATFGDLSINLAGSKQLTASSAGLTSAISNSFNISASPYGGQLVFIQQPTNTIAGVSISPAITVQLRDEFGNDVPTSGVAILMTLSSGSGTLSGTTTRLTDGTGLATFDDLSIDLVGSKNLTASTSGYTSGVSNAFIITPASANAVAFIQQPTNTTAGVIISPAITVQLRDAFGNNVPSGGVSISVNLSSGTGTLSGNTTQLTNSSGLATFGNLSIDLTGVKELTATSSGLNPAISNQFTITPSSPHHLAIIQQPTNTVAGVSINPPVTVQLKDAFGNDAPVSSISVTMTLSSGNGTLSGTLTQITNASGLATFSNLSINLVGQKNLTASSIGLISATSNSFNITPAAASQLVFTQQPTDAISGSPIVPAPVVQIRDIYGNDVPSSGISISIMLSSGSGTLSGTTTQSTNAYGFATFNDLSINLAGSKILTATSSGLTPAVSNTFNISPSSLSNFLIEGISGGNIGNQTVAIPFNIKITARDASNNTVTSFTGTTIISSSGVLSGGGGMTASFSNGVLPSHTVTLATAGPHTITATRTGGSESGTSNIFTVYKKSTTSILTASSSSSFEGEEVVLRDSVFGSVPDGGTVQFKDGLNNIGAPVPINFNGVATLSVTNLSVGTHILTALYSGTDNYEGSMSNEVIHSIGDTSLYRTFIAESLALARDNKGKMGKPVLRKAHKVDFSFEVRNEFDDITDLHVDFSVPIDTSSPFYTEPSSTISTTDTKLKKWDFTFVTPLQKGELVRIYGYGNKGKIQKVSKYYWTQNNIKVDGTFKNPTFTKNILKLPMPNPINVLYETYRYGAFTSTNGMMIGKDRSLDSSKYYGWMQMKTYKDAVKSLRDRTGIHVGYPRGFDRFTTNKPLVKRQKSIPPKKQNNKLIADMIALKMNITSSSLGITPIGFGELIYNDGTDNPCNGMMIKDIASFVDLLMMGYYSGGIHIFADTAIFRQVDSAIQNINLAFAGTMDTIKFSDSLIVPGVRKLGEVPYLLPNFGQMPTRIEPVVTSGFEIPESYTLYQNYPNPFNPTTTIEFDLAYPSIVSLKVYNILGQEVATLMDNDFLDEGSDEIEFDASNLSSGVYFYRMVAQAITDEEEGILGGKYVSVRKMLLMK